MNKPRRMADYDLKVRELEDEVQRQQNHRQAAINAGEDIRLKLVAARAENEQLVIAIKNLENREHGIKMELVETKDKLVAEQKVSMFLGDRVLDLLRQQFFRSAP